MRRIVDLVPPRLGGNKTALVTLLEAWTDVYPELPGWVADRRAEGCSGERMRRRLYAEFDIRLSRATTEKWLRDVGIDLPPRPLDPNGIAHMRLERDEARRIADLLREPLYLAAQQGWMDYVDADLQAKATEALAIYDFRSWGDA